MKKTWPRMILALTCFILPFMVWASGPDPGYSEIDQSNEIINRDIDEVSAKSEVEVAAEVLWVETVFSSEAQALNLSGQIELIAANRDGPIEVGWRNLKGSYRG